MTKADLVQEISKQTGIDRNEVLMIVEAFMETVKGSLSREKEVYLRGFGSFIIKRREEKTARNISKNTTLIIPAHDVPAFRPSKEFSNKIKKQE
jgi:DNA-binding protein HU-beta